MRPALLQLSGVVVDFTHRVARLPASGEEVEAAEAFLAPGGGFNALAAARRQGAEAAYGGTLGTGPFADLARRALRDEGAALLGAEVAGMDQGVCVVLVEPGGERSFVSHHGAERAEAARNLAGLPSEGFAFWLLSGYALYHPRCAADFADWLRAAPRGPSLLFDPGPVVADLAPGPLGAALRRADWISANRREAGTLTGLKDPRSAAAALAENRAGAMVRDGADGCWLAVSGSESEHIPGFAVEAVDTNGAGDTHDGAFIAALLGGRTPREAARLANAAAALSVTRSGPATAPTLRETLAFLDAREGRRRL